MIQAIDPRAVRQQSVGGQSSGATIEDFSSVLAATTPTATSAAGVFGGNTPASVTHAAVTGLAGSTASMGAQSPVGWTIPGSNPYAGGTTGYPSSPSFVGGGGSTTGTGYGTLGGTGSAGGVPSEVGNAITLMRDTNLQMIAIQADVQNVNREFSTLSNILKSKHDTERIAIQNMRVA